MSEAEWLGGIDPVPMLDFIQGAESDRKLRLFACACCRRVWAALTDAQSQQVVEVAERYADGEATGEELRHAEWHAEGAYFRLSDRDEHSRRACRLEQMLIERGDLDPDDGVADAPTGALLVAAQAARAADLAAGEVGAFLSSVEPHLLCPSLVRDIFGNPFRPAPFDTTWLSPSAVAIAAGCYADRAFDRLPVLADALEDAGCDSEPLLAHLRGAGPHARGCWALDTVLSKR